jgi:hypothetical protein
MAKLVGKPLQLKSRAYPFLLYARIHNPSPDPGLSWETISSLLFVGSNILELPVVKLGEVITLHKRIEPCHWTNTNSHNLCNLYY